MVPNQVLHLGVQPDYPNLSSDSGPQRRHREGAFVNAAMQDWSGVMKYLMPSSGPQMVLCPLGL